MVDKPPPRFAPEGARFNRPDWAPAGSQADQQKRTYIDKIGDLENDIVRLKATVAERDKTIAQARESHDDLLNHFYEKKDLATKLQSELDHICDDRKGDLGRISDAKAELAQAQKTVATVTAERDGAERQIVDLKSKLEAETAKYNAKTEELHALLNPPKKRWVEIAGSLPFAGFFKNYYKYEHYRSSTHFLIVFISVPFLMYFAVAGYFIGGKDDPNPCFQSGGSYFYCGAVRGILVPLKNGGAWLLGFRSDEAPTNAAATNESDAAVAADNALNEVVASAADTAEPAPTYVPPPPPQRVIDPNAIVKDLTDHATAKATELGWTSEQVSCVRTKTIDGMRTIYVGGIGQGNRESRFDSAKYQFEAADSCNPDGKDALMNDMFYDDDSYFRKIQDRIEAREFGDVWQR